MVALRKITDGMMNGEGEEDGDSEEEADEAAGSKESGSSSRRVSWLKRGKMAPLYDEDDEDDDYGVEGDDDAEEDDDGEGDNDDDEEDDDDEEGESESEVRDVLVGVFNVTGLRCGGRSKPSPEKHFRHPLLRLLTIFTLLTLHRWNMFS